MGSQAIDTNADTSTENENQDAIELDDDASGVATSEEDGQEKRQEPDGSEVEIVREGDTGSQPDEKNLGIRKRINKLNAKVDAANHTSDEANAELARSREENRLLRLSLEQTQQRGDELEAPDPLKFDEGLYDPKYVQAMTDHQEKMIQKAVQKQVATLPQNDVVQFDAALFEMQEKHYTRAEELGVKDYSETEDKAIATLGKVLVNEVIRATDRSEYILYYLGKNPDEAQRIKELVESDPIKGTLALGRLDAELKAKPKTKSSVTTPDPDEELEGGSPAANNAYQAKLDKLREKAMSGSSDAMKKVMDFKRQARKKGITLT